MRQVYGLLASYKSGDVRSLAKALESLTPGLVKLVHTAGFIPDKFEWTISGPAERQMRGNPLWISPYERELERRGHDTCIAWKARFEIPDPLKPGEEPEMLENKT